MSPASLQRYRAVVAYDGGAYQGWQAQTDRCSVQGEMERVLRQLCDQPQLKTHGSGRTDAGVHARAQVLHFDAEWNKSIARLQFALNSMLPPTIRFHRLQKALPDFHARKSAVGKEYRYFIYNGPVVSPFLAPYRCHLRLPLDVEAMRRAAAPLLGEHDFASFTANPHHKVENTVRKIHQLDLLKKGREIELRVSGNGFLYKMVRSLAGHLIQVGLGKMDASDTLRLLDARVRTHEVPTAEARGLFLWKVFYGRTLESVQSLNTAGEIG